MSSTTLSAREAQRRQTRARVFNAALAEIDKSGLARADVAAMAAAAGVARGTFYFHFPTKEHVLVELERTEEARIAAEVAADTGSRGDLLSLLTSLVRAVLEAEQRLGPVIFRDMLGLHFSPSRPVEDQLGEHPLAEFAIAAIAEAQAAGRASRDADAAELGVIFMTGLFALLVVAPSASQPRATLLDRYVKTIVRGMEEP